MDPFELPEELPTTVAELSELASVAQAAFDSIRERFEAGESLSPEDMDYLRSLDAAMSTIDEAHATAAARDAEAAETVARLSNREAPTAPAATETEAPSETETETPSETETETEAVTASSGRRRPVHFSGTGTTETPTDPEGPGWEMLPGCPQYTDGRVGFAQLARAVDSVRAGRGSRARNSNRPDRGEFASQAIAKLSRGVEEVEDSHALVAAIEKATDQRNLPGGSLIESMKSLTAAGAPGGGGWCAPSEQLYDFCDVPDAVDLISLPEITINRGGVRWPVEPDLSGIFEDFQFFFTEPELEAVDDEGNPTAVKECVSIPCPDEFEELRLNAVGYCVEAGILQTQGWPELIEWFMRSLTAEHLRAISRRTILDMVAGSGAVISIDAGTVIGTSSAIINSLALMATNLRLDRGLARNATIETVAPSWMHEAIRADLAMQGGIDVQAISDAQIASLLSARNIAPQFVGDWQSREAGKPGNLATKAWPSTIDVVMYPAGTWFRSMSNVIELGVSYPKEQLRVNRYTRFFTEDAIAVGKRCNKSINVRIPINISGAIGEREFVTSNKPVA